MPINAPMLGARTPNAGAWRHLPNSLHRSTILAGKSIERRLAKLDERYDFANALNSGDFDPTGDDIENFLATGNDVDVAFDAVDDIHPWLTDDEADVLNFDETDPAEAAFDAELDRLGITSYAELAATYVGEVITDIYEPDDTGDLPGWGTHFDPEDVQWGFTVSDRPCGSNGGRPIPANFDRS